MSNQKRQKEKKPARPGSTTSLGKRRSLREKGRRAHSPSVSAHQSSGSGTGTGSSEGRSNMSTGSSKNEYGSQTTSFRPAAGAELSKVAVLGAAGGIGQPLCMLLMLHSEYVQHVALYDVSPSVAGVALELSHIDRQCKVSAHVGPDELADAVRGAKVIVVPAGMAQKPGMSRDDLFGSNAKIMFNLAKVCAQTAPEAMLAIISNPVNSLVPLVCEVYKKYACSQQQQAAKLAGNQSQPSRQPPADGNINNSQQQHSNECCRRIFGVTTLDVVRASTLTARSGLFKPDPSSGLFKDPAKIQVPVVGGHAGKTILPLLSQAAPRIDRRRLMEDKITTHTLIESIQQAGIEVLNAKKGAGTATLSMAYSACRFAISLLRALQGEPNIVECAYVHHSQPVVSDLEYFALPLLLGKEGYVKALGFSASQSSSPQQAAASGGAGSGSTPAAGAQALPMGKLLPFELEMIEEACRELRLSVAKGEDFAKEQLASERA